jgi:2-(1,2-epoxy-1,2-dihydrophenyl)acetyl-CoA isomerase
MTILVESFAGYRQVTLNRPERLNALTVEMAAALSAALDEAAADQTCRALLLTGAGRGFCAGQDLTAIVDATSADLGHLLDHYHPLILKLRALPIPVICAVNGVAAGAGANLALACDIVLAARSASFVEAFARIGLIPDCGGTWFLPRLVRTARGRAPTPLT